jgi:hypothetical protein
LRVFVFANTAFSYVRVVSRLMSRGQHVSNATGGAEHNEQDNERPCDIEGAAKT